MTSWLFIHTLHLHSNAPSITQYWWCYALRVTELLESRANKSASWSILILWFIIYSGSPSIQVSDNSSHLRAHILKVYEIQNIDVHMLAMQLCIVTNLEKTYHVPVRCKFGEFWNDYPKLMKILPVGISFKAWIVYYEQMIRYFLYYVLQVTLILFIIIAKRICC